jgi:hypothetical protein
MIIGGRLAPKAAAGGFGGGAAGTVPAGLDARVNISV